MNYWEFGLLMLIVGFCYGIGQMLYHSLKRWLQRRKPIIHKSIGEITGVRVTKKGIEIDCKIDDAEISRLIQKGLRDRQEGGILSITNEEAEA